jgi:hypothetical protein
MTAGTAHTPELSGAGVVDSRTRRSIPPSCGPRVIGSEPGPAAHGCRTASRLVAWSRGRPHPQVRAWAPLARTSATPSSRGPWLPPPGCAGGTSPTAHSPWAAGRNSLLTATRSPASRTHWRGPSLTGSSATRPVSRTWSAGPTRAERGRRRSHGPPRGMRRHRACSPSCGTASWHVPVCTSALSP